jgi:hypothetical protein
VLGAYNAARTGCQETSSESHQIVATGGNRLPPRIEPETFRTSRLLDFATQRELTAQIGHKPGMWSQVVVKELVANALDAAEQAEVAPRIEVTITESMIEILDSGPGIPGSVIEDAKGLVADVKRVTKRWHEQNEREIRDSRARAEDPTLAWDTALQQIIQARMGAAAA